MLTPLKTLKETLKPCSENPTSSISSSYSTQPLSQESAEPTKFPRKPPRSNLSQQLQRLGESFSVSERLQSQVERTQLTQKSAGLKTHFPVERVGDEGEAEEDEDDREEEERKFHDFGRPERGRFVFDHTGPFEPLVLSLTGEAPVVQLQASLSFALTLLHIFMHHVPASINCRLLEHQRVGVKFLYQLYRNNHGGILGDDMGLGKTIQTIAFLAAIYGKGESSDSNMLNQSQTGSKGPVLIICPTSVIHNWESEFSTWATFNVCLFHGSNRDVILEKLEARRVDILITSFDTYRIHGSVLMEVQWEIGIVDEAHRLKNDKSKLYSACLQIGTMNRIGLTGTVMQNKIMELFNLFDWVAPGCLGTREHFRKFYDEPLKQGQRSTAPERFVRVADERKEHLVIVLRKYMLRRTKEETIGHLMMGKEDNAVFCAMSELQKQVYRRMLQLPDIQCLINKDLPCECGSPLKQVECCKRIVPDGIIWPYLHRDNPEGCDSCPFCLVLPCLLKLQQISNHLELVKPNPRDELDRQRKDAEFSRAVFGTDIDLVRGNAQDDSFMGLSDVKHCGKMRALEKLLVSWTSSGDKILLFSYTVRMLDILEKFLIRRGYSFSRLDGSTPSNLRQSLVDDFNRSPSKQVFLVSTRAGGLGLNLVSANRVVIFDPNWNPAWDLQAQDRSFRFGQKRHVVVFRLLAAGSFEELVYSRQIYKQQLSNVAVSGKTEKRYFEGVQDCKELQGELFGICNLFRDLSDKLFTSEIIELHEKHGKSDWLCPGMKQNSPEIQTTSHLEEHDMRVSSGSETNKPRLCESFTSNPAFEEFGVLYAHRNEDIVNAGPGINNKKRGVILKDISEADPIRRRLKSKDGGVGKSGLSSSDRKKIQYSLLAQSLGMAEIDFSKWVLSATALERENVLRNYKSKRGKKPSG